MMAAGVSAPVGNVGSAMVEEEKGQEPSLESQLQEIERELDPSVGQQTLSARALLAAENSKQSVVVESIDEESKTNTLQGVGLNLNRLDAPTVVEEAKFPDKPAQVSESKVKRVEQISNISTQRAS